LQSEEKRIVEQQKTTDMEKDIGKGSQYEWASWQEARGAAHDRADRRVRVADAYSTIESK